MVSYQTFPLKLSSSKLIGKAKLLMQCWVLLLIMLDNWKLKRKMTQKASGSSRPHPSNRWGNAPSKHLVQNFPPCSRGQRHSDFHCSRGPWQPVPTSLLLMWTNGRSKIPAAQNFVQPVKSGWKNPDGSTSLEPLNTFVQDSIFGSPAMLGTLGLTSTLESELE